ncbi:MAG: 8-oxo-dGTP diphosphatase [Elusimicrobia bacterium]|nr:8-oxo-dGTP diphosphatase [Elusimicrobiota bacterium]
MKSARRRRSSAPAPREPDWTAWTPTERAALCFILREGRILLIHKKRGLGAGKVNGPGGRLEAGESPADAARRETREEVGLDPYGLEEAGELRFQFLDGYALHCTVFTASGAEGTPVETPEAVPFWAETSAVPYDEMWTDDRHWIPWMLARRRFRGLFHYDGDRMLSGRVEPAG